MAAVNSKIDKYILELKSKLNRNYLSPLFIRYANLLFANEQYEECISVCMTGLQIYPNYLTAKLILLKAYMKAEYLNEAEILFGEIKSRITNKDMKQKLESNIRNLKSISKQEKIYYPTSARNKIDFKNFNSSFQLQENLFSEFTLNDFFSAEDENIINDNKDYLNYQYQFENFHFRKSKKDTEKKNQQLLEIENKNTPDPESELFNKIKIVTETLADIYASQKNYKEAFDAYNFLLRAGSGNTKRIEEKLQELERNMMNPD